MNWLTKFLTSSIGRKLLMSLTGLFLCSFLVVHLIGNLQLFNHDNGYSFNKYAVFMTSNPLIKTISYGLYATILFHAFWGLYLVARNKKARPVPYAVVDGNANSAWTSRYMGVLGTAILVFIAVHMQSFWYQYKFTESVPYVQYEINTANNEMLSSYEVPAIEVKMQQTVTLGTETTVVKNLYIVVAESFKVWWIVLFYIIAMFALSFHLVHGFRSAFQTLGVNHSKYNGLINFVGVGVFGVIIPVLFAAMPIYFFIL